MIAGDVVLLTFPFSDLSGSKLRPAVVLAVVDRDEFIVCQITSKRKSDARALELSSVNFTSGGLRITSFARPAKLFTVHRTLVVRRVAVLRSERLEAIRAAVVRAIEQKK